MSDSEQEPEQQLEQELEQKQRRQRSPRPVSTMALDFNNFLDGAFNLGGEIPTLMETVQEKQDQVSKHNRELEALEARLKAMEERLSKAGISTSSKNTTEQQSEASPRPKSSRSTAPPPPSRAPPPPVPSDTNRPPSRAPPSRPGTSGRPQTSSRNATYDYESHPMPEAREQSEYGVAH